MLQIFCANSHTLLTYHNSAKPLLFWSCCSQGQLVVANPPPLAKSLVSLYVRNGITCLVRSRLFLSHVIRNANNETKTMFQPNGIFFLLQTIVASPRSPTKSVSVPKENKQSQQHKTNSHMWQRRKNVLATEAQSRGATSSFLLRTFLISRSLPLRRGLRCQSEIQINLKKLFLKKQIFIGESTCEPHNFLRFFYGEFYTR